MKPSRRRAVILLEAIISLVVIAGVAGACVGLRSRALRQRIAVQQALETDNAIDAILTLATSDLLGPPEVEADDAGGSRQVWRGAWRGSPYIVTAEVVDVVNPFASASLDAPPTVPMRRWTVEHLGVRADELRLAVGP